MTLTADIRRCRIGRRGRAGSGRSPAYAQDCRGSTGQSPLPYVRSAIDTATLASSKGVDRLDAPPFPKGVLFPVRLGAARLSVSECSETVTQ